jgi:cation:H+ antiporter
LVWLKFLLCVVVILYAGMKLARYGDAIAEKSGLGRMWIGLVLLAFVTSLPELVTGVSSAVLVKIPDLALGTLFGSCTFNLAILVVLDIINWRTPILSEASRNHLLSAVYGILLLAIAGASIYIEGCFSVFSLGWVGIPSIVIITVYVLAMRHTFYFERRHRSGPVQEESLRYEEVSAGKIYLSFGLAAIAVIGAAIWLSYIGDEIARTTGWDTSFVGSMFLAFTTSLPELAVTVAAIRIGATDMAVADVLGANMINIAKIFVVDLFYTQGSVLSSVSGVHIITDIVSIAMTVVVILGLHFRAKRKTFIVFSWYVPVLIALYIFGAYMLFSSGISC